MQSREEKFITMTEAPLKPLILRLALPTILSMLVTSFYNMADTYFVGQVKIDATTSSGAVAVVFSLMNIIQAFGFFFGHGSGNYISRALGRKDSEDAERMATNAFVYALLFGCFISAAGLIFLKPLAILLGSTDTIAPYACEYMKWILLAAPFMCPSLVLNNQMRFQGNAAFAMVGIISGAILNIILDPIFIFGFDMGIAGAGLATMIGQMLSFVILLFCSRRGDNIRINLRKFSPSWRNIAEIARGGSPSLCRQGIASIGTITVNTIAGNYGDAVVSAMGVVSRIMMFAASAVIGFGQAFQPICGFSYGAKIYSRVKASYWFSVRVSVYFLTAMGILLYIFAPQITQTFRDDPAVISFATASLRYQAIFLPLSSIIIYSNMFLQTIGRSLPASILAMTRNGLALVPCVLLFSHFWGESGLQFAQAGADIASFLLALPLSLYVLSRLPKRDGEEDSSYKGK